MATKTFPSRNPNTEWRSSLSADQFRVLREHGTERAGTSPLNYEKRTGVYHCAACDQPLFESSTKYESGSGWPSFFRPLPGAVATTTDARTAWRGSKCTARTAAAISAMCSTTARRRPGSVTA